MLHEPFPRSTHPLKPIHITQHSLLVWWGLQSRASRRVRRASALNVACAILPLSTLPARKSRDSHTSRHRRVIFSSTCVYLRRWWFRRVVVWSLVRQLDAPDAFATRNGFSSLRIAAQFQLAAQAATETRLISLVVRPRGLIITGGSGARVCVILFSTSIMNVLRKPTAIRNHAVQPEEQPSVSGWINAAQ